jgi:ubiquinone/menaquinone biosynthesis C-methylase UbiE
VDKQNYIHLENETIGEEARLRYQADVSEEFLWKNVESSLKSLPYSQRVLEIGCGVSAQTEHLLKRLPVYSHVTATDIDQNQLDIAIEHAKSSMLLKENATYKVEDATQLSFSDSTFDGVYVCWVLEHLSPSDVKKAIAEATRVLKNGGWLIVNEIFMSSGDGVVGYKKDNSFPEIMYSYIDALAQSQIAMGGNPKIGEIESLKIAVTHPNLYLEQIRQIPMAYNKNHPEFSLSIQDGINLFTSLRGKLENSYVNLLGSNQELIEEMKELESIAWNFGQAFLKANKER